MKHKVHFISKGFILIMLALLFQGFSKKPGGDYYRIFLNEKLITEQFLTQPKGLVPLSLTTANVNDQLIIQFSHCGVAGKNRTILLKDEKGKLLKEWKYSDTKSIGMQVPVKELLQASDKIRSCSIHYASKEKTSSLMLAKLDLKKPAVAKQ